MTLDFTDQIDKLFKIWVEIRDPDGNYTHTYPKHICREFLKDFEDLLMFYHCIEDRKSMNSRDKQSFKHWKENAIIDKKAHEEQEYKDSLHKSLRD